MFIGPSAVGPRKSVVSCGSGALFRAPRMAVAVDHLMQAMQQQQQQWQQEQQQQPQGEPQAQQYLPEPLRGSCLSSSGPPSIASVSTARMPPTPSLPRADSMTKSANSLRHHRRGSALVCRGEMRTLVAPVARGAIHTSIICCERCILFSV